MTGYTHRHGLATTTPGHRLTATEQERFDAETERRNRWNDYRNALTRDGYTWDEAHNMTVAHFAQADHTSADDAADAIQQETR